jgi:ComF family protein
MCQGCQNGIEFQEEFERSSGLVSCQVCHLPLRPGQACAGCVGRPPAYVQARAVGVLDGVLRAAIHAFKYHQGWRLAEPLAEAMWCRWRRTWDRSLDFDGLVAIPTAAERELARGYNQAELLASRLAVRSGVPRQLGLLLRTTEAVQSRLGSAARHEHASRLFDVRPGASLGGRRLLLVDDIMTTGATLGAAASLLRRSGAEVYALVLARQPLNKLIGTSKERTST